MSLSHRDWDEPALCVIRDYRNLELGKRVPAARLDPMAELDRGREYAKAVYEPGTRETGGKNGWRLVSIKGDHYNFKHPDSRFIVTIAHQQKDVPVGRATDTVRKIRLEVK